MAIRLYTTVFIIGALIAVFWFTFNLLFSPFDNLQSILIIAITSSVEEIFKFLAVLALIPLIGLKPAQIPFLGMGFGFTEAIIRIIESEPMAIGYRLKPFWAHIIFGLVMALFFWLAQRTEKRFRKGLYYSLALVIPAVLHLSYNLFVRFFI